MINGSMDESEQWLREYAASGSEPAFRRLVERHLNLVFSTALRATADPQVAEDVAQVVFSDLAAKAGRIPSGTVVVGWLYRHTSFTAAKMLRAERRRVDREKESMRMEESASQATPELDGRLEKAMAKLRDSDRDALVLRFLEARDLRAVGATLGISEDAAQKRVARALEKLRGLLASEGLGLSALALASALGAARAAAPAGLSARIGEQALQSMTTLSSAGASSVWGSASMKSVAALLAGVALGVPLVLQWRALSARAKENRGLREEVATLRAQASDADALRAQLAELDGLRRDNAELHKLRAEVTALHQRLRESEARAAAKAAALEPAEPPAPAQVLVEANFAEVPPEVIDELHSLGHSRPRGPDRFGHHYRRTSGSNPGRDPHPRGRGSPGGSAGDDVGRPSGTRQHRGREVGRRNPDYGGPGSQHLAHGLGRSNRDFAQDGVQAHGTGGGGRVEREVDSAPAGPRGNEPACSP